MPPMYVPGRLTPSAPSRGWWCRRVRQDPYRLFESVEQAGGLGFRHLSGDGARRHGWLGGDCRVAWMILGWLHGRDGFDVRLGRDFLKPRRIDADERDGEGEAARRFTNNHGVGDIRIGRVDPEGRGDLGCDRSGDIVVHFRAPFGLDSFMFLGAGRNSPHQFVSDPTIGKLAVPTTWFVNSMGDIFHEDVPDEWIDQVFAVMALTPQHTYQVLTKRSARMREYVSGARDRIVRGATVELPPRTTKRTKIIYRSSTRVGSEWTWPLPNVWLGVSTERQKEADERIPDLLATPAAVRFISAEPLLGPIDLRHIAPTDTGYINALSSSTGPNLDWVIVGGENGERPMHPDHARALRDQSTAAGTPFFFKQWGTNIPDQEREGRYRRVPKRIAGRTLDGIEHNGMPEAR